MEAHQLAADQELKKLHTLRKLALGIITLLNLRVCGEKRSDFRQRL
jgi:hypothetical protein